jgi:hypothetical protein
VPPTAPAATYDAVVAMDELIDTLAVPNVDPLWVPMKEPVNEPVLTLNVIDVAAEDVNANEDEIALFAQLAVPKVEPLCVPMKEPVKEPVLTLNVIEVAAEAVVAKDAVAGLNVIDVAAEEVVANEEEIALFAQLAVPNVDPL